MAESTGTAADGKLEKLSRAVNRRKAALGKLRAGGPSAVSERALRKLVKRAERRKKKIEKAVARHPGRAPAATATAPEQG